MRLRGRNNVQERLVLGWIPPRSAGQVGDHRPTTLGDQAGRSHVPARQPAVLYERVEAPRADRRERRAPRSPSADGSGSRARSAAPRARPPYPRMARLTTQSPSASLVDALASAPFRSRRALRRRGVQVTAERIEDDTEHRYLLVDQGDRDAEVRNPVRVVDRPVQRVDRPPAPGAIGPAHSVPPASSARIPSVGKRRRIRLSMSASDR